MMECVYGVDDRNEGLKVILLEVEEFRAYRSRVFAKYPHCEWRRKVISRDVRL